MWKLPFLHHIHSEGGSWVPAPILQSGSPEELLTCIKHHRKEVLAFLHISVETISLIHQIPYSHCNILLSNPCNLIFQEYANIFKNCTTVFFGATVHSKNQNPHFQSCDIHKLASAFSQGIQRHSNQCPGQTAVSPAAAVSAALTHSRASCFCPAPSCVLTAPTDTGAVRTTHQDNSHTTEANHISSPHKGKFKNCKFGSQSLLASRLQNVPWVRQWGSKTAFKHQFLRDFQPNCSGSG